LGRPILIFQLFLMSTTLKFGNESFTVFHDENFNVQFSVWKLIERDDPFGSEKVEEIYSIGDRHFPSSPFAKEVNAVHETNISDQMRKDIKQYRSWIERFLSVASLGQERAKNVTYETSYWGSSKFVVVFEFETIKIAAIWSGKAKEAKDCFVNAGPCMENGARQKFSQLEPIRRGEKLTLKRADKTFTLE
jgi:hypothetical protein